MKYAHLTKLTAFSYEHEDRDSVFNAFQKFFPFDLRENEVKLKKTNASGFNEKKIDILEVSLIKNSLINQFLTNLLKHLDKKEQQKIIQHAESRLDNNLDFFLKFDKDSWIYNNKLILTDSGKCFHLKVSIAAFPKKREIALNLINELFSGK